MSVRQVEEMVREEKESGEANDMKTTTKYFDFSNYIKDKSVIEKKFNTDVRFKSRSNDNGTIIISFSSKEQLEDILNKMK